MAFIPSSTAAATLSMPGETLPPSPPVAAAGAGAPSHIGRFQIRQRLGEGAFGVVYRAHDPQLDREIALKVAKPDQLSSAKRVERFLREAKAAAQLRHPHIVPLHEAGRDGDHYYIAAAFISGQTLEQAIEAQRFDFQRTAQVIRQLAEALAYAHAQGIVHRDVKPANVMLDDKGQPLLMDFGLAARQEGAEKLTQEGAILGTPLYMAPEQARGQSGDPLPASDQYSLGVMLYEMLCGQTPFSGPPEIVIFNHLNVEPMSPRQTNQQVPRDLETICLKAMAKQPGERYADCQALADDLRRWLEREPILARRLGLGERAVRWVRKEPKLAGAVALVIATVLTALLMIADSRDEAVKSAEREKKEKKEKADALIAKERALEKEKEAKGKEKDAREKADLRLAMSYLDQGVADGDAGRQFLGVFRLSEAYSLLPPEHSLRASARLMLADRYQRTGMVIPHDAATARVALSPDGQSILAGSEDGVARLWDVKSGKPVAEFRGQKGRIGAVAFSPGSKRVLIGNEQQSAQLWDVGTGKPLGQRLHPQGNVVVAVFGQDGKTLVTGGYDKTARLWNAATGEPLNEPLVHNGLVTVAALSPDGKTLWTGCELNPQKFGERGYSELRLWDVATGKPLTEPLRQESWIRHLSFTPDQRSILVDSQPVARLLDATTGRPRETPAGFGASSVSIAAMSPDGRTVATVGPDRAVRLWDAATGQARGESLPHENQIRCVVFSPDGRLLLSAGDDKTARLWDVVTGQSVANPFRHEAVVGAAAFSADGTSVLTACSDQTVWRWDVTTGMVLGDAVPRLVPTLALAFSSNGNTLVAGGYAGNAHLWDLTTGKPLGEPLRHKGPVRAAAFSPSGRTVITSCQLPSTGEAWLWDTSSGKAIAGPLRHRGWIHWVAFSPDGTTCLTGAIDRVQIWDAATGKPRASLQHPKELSADILAFAMSANGKLVLTGGFDGTARLWDAASGKAVGKPLAHDSHVLAVAFSPDGQTVVTGGQDRKARVWEVATGTLRLESLHQGGVNVAAFSPDGSLIATAGGDKAVHLWSATTGKPATQPLQHTDSLKSLAFSADGRVLLTWVENTRTARLWDTTSGKPLATPVGMDGTVTGIALSPDGKAVATGGPDGTARLWPIEPLPFPDDPKIVSLLVADRTALSRGSTDVIGPLPYTGRLQRRKELLSSAADTADAHDKSVGRRDLRWHRYQAEAAERSGHWYAAAFHLGYLMRDDPTNAEWRTRREQVVARTPIVPPLPK